jgi:mono/diheme cytochrome c family protein
VAIMLASAPTLASDPAALDLGRRIAETYCGTCHATGPSGASPHRIVIPFRDLHQRLPIEMLDEARQTGFIAGHDEMPMFELGPERVAALIAYLESLWPAPVAPEGAARKP